MFGFGRRRQRKQGGILKFLFEAFVVRWLYRTLRGGSRTRRYR